jgi:GST-like protein
LRYLADKTGRFGGSTVRSRVVIDEWLSWQIGGLGPMLGQANHFSFYAKEKIPYAIQRYIDEGKRLLHVMERRLEQTKFLAGEEYTIADMASYPWVRAVDPLRIDLSELPEVRRWLDAVVDRPAVARGMALKP